MYTIMNCLPRIPPIRFVAYINRNIHASTTSNAKQNTSLSRQSRIFDKLLGSRVSGSKKRWYPSDQSTSSQQAQVTLIRDIGKSQKKQGKNASRRLNVLNKMFMKHITDQLATGSVSEQILGKGLEISRVKVTPDFNGVNVYWIARGDCSHSDADIETILHRCSGILRHELSQLRLMGEVPRVYFVKDKLYANIADVEHVLKNCDLESDEDHDDSYRIQEELGLNRTKANMKDLPPMRHDVLGLDHKEIMTGILVKMKKSKESWKAYEAAGNGESASGAANTVSSTPRLDALREKMEEARVRDEQFKKFLNTRSYRPVGPDRKKPPIHVFDEQEYEVYEEQFGISVKDDGDYIEESENKS